MKCKNLVTEEDIIKTYSKKQQELSFQYLKVIELRKKYGWSKYKIAEHTGFSEGRIKHWIYDKTEPFPIKTIEKLKFMNLLPFSTKNKNFLLIIDCFAFVFGDGHLTNDSVDFSSICKADLLTLKKKLSNISFKGKIRKRILKNHVMYDGKILNGMCHILRVCSSALSRLLISLSAPKGDKTMKLMILPSWLMESSNEIKSRFLGVLYGNEGSTPNLTNNYNSISHLRLKFVKEVRLKKEHEKFLTQLKELFNSLDISTSKIRWENKFIKRKDGIVTQPAYFDIYNNFPNFLKFCKRIPILYNSSKMKSLEFIVDNVKIKVNNHLDNCKKYYQMLNLLKNGFNLNQISLKLNINYKTLEYWKKGGKPLMYSKQNTLYDLTK